MTMFIQEIVKAPATNARESMHDDDAICVSGGRQGRPRRSVPAAARIGLRAVPGRSPSRIYAKIS